MRFIGVIILCLCSTSAFAVADFHVDLKTPDNRAIKLDIYNPNGAAVLLLAPGQGCGSRLEMFDPIGTEAKAKGFTVVRLYWAYCLADPAKGRPSIDLSLERADFLKALDYVRQAMQFADAHIYIGGKSLGTEVAFPVFEEQKGLQGLLLLTPLCTDADTNPGQHTNVFAEVYPGLENEARPVLLAQGNRDSLCETAHFQEYLSDKGKNLIPVVLKGDHGFGIQNPDGSYDADQGARNLQALAKWIFSWLG